MPVTAEKEINSKRGKCLVGISDSCYSKFDENTTLKYGICPSCIFNYPYIASKLCSKTINRMGSISPSSCYRNGMTFSDSKQRAKPPQPPGSLYRYFVSHNQSKPSAF